MRRAAARDAATIHVNGEPRHCRSGMTLPDLLAELGVRRELVAVEVNRELVRRSEFDSTVLRPGDQVEVVEFVGGG